MTVEVARVWLNAEGRGPFGPLNGGMEDARDVACRSPDGYVA